MSAKDCKTFSREKHKTKSWEKVILIQNFIPLFRLSKFISRSQQRSKLQNFSFTFYNLEKFVKKLLRNKGLEINYAKDLLNWLEAAPLDRGVYSKNTTHLSKNIVENNS